MATNFTSRTTSLGHSENASFGGKAVVPVADPAKAGQRRVLSDLTNATATAAAMAKPTGAAVVARPAGIPMHQAFVAGGAAPIAPAADNIRTEVINFGGRDFDAADIDNPEAVPEYVDDIYNFFKENEISKTAKFGYMAHQSDINEKMRAILIDWLVEVHLKFKLMPETMYLTVNLIDRFLERKIVVRQKLQLVGVTAMLLASKYEEIYAPEVRDFVYITDKAYTKEQILMMEATMLNALDFRVTVPTPYVFLNRFLKMAGETDASAKLSLLATYFVERSMQEYKFLHYAPSKIAAAGVNIALRTLRGAGGWDARMERFTGFKQAELVDTIRDMQACAEGQAANNLKAVHKKYSQAKYAEVAMIPVPAL